MVRSQLRAARAGFVLVLACSSLSFAARPKFHIIDSLALGGLGDGDELAVDSTSGHLCISRGSFVQVIDMQDYSLVGNVPDTRGVHGIAVAPITGRGYTSNGADSSVTVFDLSTLNVVARISIDGVNPDAILFDRFTGRIFTFNSGSGNATVIDAATNGVLGTVELNGRPSGAVSDQQGTIYVTIEDRGELAEIDARTMAVLHRWPLAPGKSPRGLAIDPVRRRLFSGCSNRLLVVVDAGNGRVISTLPIGRDVGAVAFDPANRTVFTSNGEGTITVIAEKSAHSYRVEDIVPTRKGARTLVVDDRTHRLYTVTAAFAPPSQAAPGHPHPPPVMVPGSVVLYTLSR